MANSVENEIVAMKFENTQFEKGVSQSLSTLDRLKASLKFDSSSKSLGNLQSASKGFNMNPLVDSAAQVSKAFSAMSVVAITAIATIASQATNAGLNIAKSFTIAPISQGFQEYETQMGAIQTVLANTGLEGESGLNKVNSALEELNAYSDQTIYNFTEMAKNIGTFTAAGVDLDTSAGAIKGIANLAAVSGSTSEQASTAMYQLSQALSSGRVSLMDWNSVVNAGLGGKVFQKALTDTARQQGVDVDAMIAKNGSFRDSLQEGWITGTVLTDTLAKFTGDLSKEQLLQQGYSETQALEIMKLGETASDAATKVKTFSQLMSTLKEAVSSGWAKTFQLIFGDFNEAKEVFTGASKAIGGLIGTSSDNRNNMLKDWAALDGRTMLIDGIKNAWEALGSVLGPIRDGFREIFPATTAKQLAQLTRAVRDFFGSLILGAEAQENLKNTFAGFFAVIHIGVTIISGILRVLATLIGLFVSGQGSTLAFTGGIGQALVAFDRFLTKGKFVENFFDVLIAAIKGVFTPLIEFKDAIVGAFTGLVTLDPSGIFDSLLGAIQSVLGLVDNLSDGFANAFNTISSSLGGFGSISGFDLSGMFGDATGASKSISGIKSGLDSVGDSSGFIKTIWDGITGAFDKALGIISSIGDRAENVGTSLASAGGSAGAGVSGVVDSIIDAVQGVGPALQEALGSSLGNLSFEEFAAALNLTMFVLIYRQFKKFGDSIRGIAESASGILDQITGNLKTMQADVRADIIFKIAASLALLAAAVFLLAQADPKRLGIALAAVAAMLLMLVVAMKSLEKSVSGFSDGAKMVAIGAAMAIMAVALAAMAAAVYLFSLINPGDLAQGLIGVTASIAVLTAAAVALSKGGAGANMIGAATGLLIMSAALVAMAGAILVYDKIDPDTMKSGLIKIAAALAVLVTAMAFMQSSVGGAVAMVIIAGALLVLSEVFRQFASIPTEDIKKAMVTMAAALLILVVAMNAMQTGLVGAGALVLMVAALTLLIPVIIAAGQLDWETVGKGLVILVGSMLALALAAAAISPVIPVIAALASAVALVGGAVFLAGAGIALFAAGMVALAINGQAGFSVFIKIIDQFLDKLPEMIRRFGDTISAIAEVIGEKAPEMIDAFTKIISAMLDGAITLMPKFGKFLGTMITTGLRVLESYINDMIDTGMRLIISFLRGIEDNVDRIVDIATNIIIKFINALSRNGVKLAKAGLDALIDFLNGLANAIESRSGEINAAGGRVATAIIDGVKDGIGNAVSSVAGSLQSMLSAAASRLNPINIGKNLVKGLGGGSFRTDAEALTGTFINLVGGLEEVNGALDNIQGQISDTLSGAESKASSLKSRVEELKKVKNRTDKQDKALNKAKKDRKDAEDLAAAAKGANKDLKAMRATQIATLQGLANAYDALNKKIEDQRVVLKGYEEDRAAMQASVNATFNAKPDIQATQTLSQYMREIGKQQAKVEKFNATLAALRSQGLSDDSYRQFLTEGLDAQRVMDGLVTGGAGAINSFQSANSSLAAASQSLASAATANLQNGTTGLTYDNAVTTANNFLNGLINGMNGAPGLAALEASMTNIAIAIQGTLRKKLKIKSPSRVAMEIGGFVVKGLTNGMDDLRSTVATSSAALGQEALGTLQNTLSNVGNGLSGQINMSPVITPVLDLTQLTKDASGISGILAVPPITAGVSFAQASDISTGRAPSETDEATTDGSGGDTYVEYNQTINSPRAIDDVGLYRNTKNLLSLEKSRLG